MKFGIINSNHWKRKSIYEHFRDYDDPTYGMTVDIDCTNAYSISKSLATSFFLFYMHKSITAVNQVDALKLRIVDEQVRIYDQIDISTTIHRPDGTFGFAYMPYKKPYPGFAEYAKQEIARVQNRQDLEPKPYLQHIIKYTTIPWVSFSAVSHAVKNREEMDIPYISFGKIKEIASRLYLPMSIHVHHALVDGRDIGEYVDRFQELMNNIDGK